MPDLLTEKIAVTGPTGFIGSHLVKALVEIGCRPTLLARAPRHDRLDPAAGKLRWVKMDITDRDSVDRVISQEPPDVIFHLAGTRGRHQTADAFQDCTEVNILGTVRLLAAATRAGVGRVVLLGSADEYGNQPGPLSENLNLQPKSPYAISVAAATRLAQAMFAKEGCPVVVLRPFTVYGPGQPSDMFVAEAIECAVEGTTFRMTEGKQRRDLVFVADLIRAIISAAQSPDLAGRVINVGSGECHKLCDVANLIWALTSSNAPLLIGARQAESAELHDTWADISLARELLGWTPRVNLETGLAVTIEWNRQRAACKL
jgi:nucleoside-diphosphate-sugar epimerase